MIDQSQMKLGKKAAVHDPRTLKLAKYLRQVDLPEAPASVDWSAIVHDWGMMCNDRYGDCAIAGPGHKIQSDTANADHEVIIPDAEILGAYSAVSGFDPATGANDNGCVLLCVMKYWRKLGIGGHKIGAFSAISLGDIVTFRQALWLFEGLVIGLDLPVSAQNQEVWDVPPSGYVNGQGAAGSWGGHCVVVLAEDMAGLTCVTWGQTKRMTWDFLQAYMDEAYAAISQDMLNAEGDAPTGFNIGQLQEDLDTI